jgi:glycosyltransferase involved in cell wall biosynthesis
MRESDILVLPSIEEGSALVAAEARGSGCALLVSEAAGAVCKHMENAMVHRVGDTATLAHQITTLHEDRGLLANLRAMSLRMVPEITWTAAGVKLLEVYRQVIEEHKTREDHDRIAKRQTWSGAKPVASASNTTQVSCRADISTPYTQETLEPAKRKYVLISPVRDEDRYIVSTLDSVIGQTVRPAEWVIVDDGSNDKTGKIIDEYAKQYPWIIALHRADRGRRLAGTGVMEAFHYGYKLLQSQDWNFIGKLDGDVGLQPDYFEACLQRFEQNAKLGICGGVMYCEQNGQLKLDEQPTDHVRGALKLYRRSCWQDIGGLIRTTGWDTVDEAHANMLGWQTTSFSELRVIHHRPTGAAAGGWRDNMKNGVADYVSGYHPLFLVVKCLKRSLQKPYMLKSLAHAYGYLSAYARKMPRGGNKDLLQYVRSKQMRRLFPNFSTNSK